ncbi:DNA polymerase phi-domain-containing protein [Amylocystis lapponica]|nr:DNA polymerase phi-domain-containing protein [Amylocystis lapponica]
MSASVGSNHYSSEVREEQDWRIREGGADDVRSPYVDDTAALLELVFSLKKERVDASVKLITSLEHFQAQFAPQHSPDTTDEDEDRQEDAKGDGLDALNAQDVSYSVRRLVRGLASPRESSRLGFAVALTELLSRISTVTCAQIVALIMDSSKTQGSATGQEERDMLFARLFGLTLSSYKEVLAELLALGEKKSWLRESAWWTIGLAVDVLENKIWTPEKVALVLKLQSLYPSRDWRKLLSPTFKQSEILSTGNLTALAKVLKESNVDDDEESDLPKSGSWKAQVHFVWDMLLDEILSDPASGRRSKASFPEFFRIVVDGECSLESLFSSTSSPERKYWGFQVFQKALPRVGTADMPMLFTKNFMRSWINHLSNSDRYLHKAARQVAADILAVVKQNPTIGFTLILQLTGVNGSRQFDKLTKTKTVESILTSMNSDGIKSYIDYLLKQVNEDGATPADLQAINARRAWIIDQLAALIRNGAIPKSDDWIQSILDWLAVHGLFIVTKKSDKSPLRGLHSVPAPPFSDELRKSCRGRLLNCLAELTGQSALIKGDNKTLKAPAAASDGELWVSKVLSTVERLENDTKHVKLLDEADEDVQQLRLKVREVIERLRKVQDERQEAAKGAELLLSATLLHQYCADEETDSGALESCIDGASRMFPLETKKAKKSRKSAGGEKQGDEEALEAVDVLVDTVIGFLEEATAYMRAVANQVFSMLSGSVQESTIDLILTQLERRDPTELVGDEDEDEEMDDAEGGDNSEDSADEEQSDDDDEDDEEAEDPELRRKIEEALHVNGIDAATGDSDNESEEELMDDEQMMAIDEQLAAVFRARADEKKFTDTDAQREATHFKNRVLDLLETFIKKQPKNPLQVRLILPLVELIVSTGPDEKQLADKATGILRSRIGKSRETPSTVDTDQAATVLEELHTRARTAPSSDVLATLSQCSLYLCRSLHHAKEDESILKAYRGSLVDFVSRKSSRLNANLFQDLIRRHTDVAWGLRDDLVGATGKAVNAYRQCQVFQLIQTLINQLPALNDRHVEILEYMPKLRAALHDVISGACDGSLALTPAQTKELFKLGLAAIRQTRRIAPTKLSVTWDPPTWTAMTSKLAESDRLKSATNLQTMCKQMAQTAGQVIPEKDATSRSKSDNDAVTAKRKVDALDDEGEAALPTKTKRKKVKKNKS